ncbi:hypothetical protein [Streptomyces marincola]|uniref:Lipoprotein n=1 Tax=Streptomyces marincola TaxID=2878388 RepID=A0A1W7D3D3_9ACTN|nr:hypothetical protein [Streptomyces marincola]ARQ71504.1 hypothetical protein CAG99_24115 [Streptomyces marincola]
MTTYVSRRRAVLRCLAAVALGAVALTGCGGGGESRAADATAPGASAEPSGPADEADPPSAAGDGTDPRDTAASDGEPAPEGTAAWAGTKQFAQIDDAWISEGRTYVSVRPAQKEARTQPHEAWVVVPSEGPYTTVAVADDARMMLSVPLGDDSRASAYSQAEFVSRLTDHSPAARSGFGYDLSFDGEGRVVRLETLYMP